MQRSPLRNPLRSPARNPLRGPIVPANPELVTNIVTDAGSSYAEGVLTLVQNGGNEFAQTDAGMSQPKSYMLLYTVDSDELAGDGLFFADSSSSNFVLLPRTAGEHSVEISPSFTDDLRFIIRIYNGQIVISGISIKELI